MKVHQLLLPSEKFLLAPMCESANIFDS